MTEGRRTLRFERLDEVMPEVERLLAGHETLGTWSLAQICRHLAMSMRRAVDLPASTTFDPALRVSDEQKRRVFETGQLPEALPGPPEIMPGEVGDARAEADGLREAIAYFHASPTGPQAPHRFFGPMSRDEWEQLQRIHCAHHLSFVVPR